MTPRTLRAGHDAPWGQLILGVAVVCLAACSQKPFFDESACLFKVHNTQTQGGTIRCGVLNTPEQHQAPSKLIQVPVLIFKGTNKNAAPVVNLAGGPGQSWNDLGLDTISAA